MVFSLSWEVDVQYLVGNLVAKMLDCPLKDLDLALHVHRRNTDTSLLEEPAQITKCGPGFYDALGQTSPLHPLITQQTLKKPFLGSLYNFSVASDVQFQGFILNFIRLSMLMDKNPGNQLIWYKSYEFTYTVSIQNPSQTHKETCFYMSHTICPTGCAWNFGWKVLIPNRWST